MIIKRKLYTKKDTNANLLMNIEGIASISLLGIVALGKLESTINVGDKVFINEDNNRTYTISHIIFNIREDKSQWPKFARKGDTVGLILKNCNIKDIKKGYSLFKK